MKKLLFLSLLLAPVMALASLWDYYGTDLPTIADRGILAQKYGIVEQAKDYKGTANQNIALEKVLTIKMADLYQNQYLGASVLPIAGATYNLAGSGVSSSATSITLQSLTIPQTGQKIQDSDLSDTFYITLEPGNRTRQEISSCTTVVQNGSGTATLSGCSRGLSPITPYTASTTLAFVHAGGSQVIFSDPPQLFNQFAAKDNAETITKIWTYSVYPESGAGTNATTTNQFITLGQANSIGNQGAATSSPTNAGISEEATQLEMASSTPFDANNPHYISSEYASSTPTVRGLGYVPVTENDGYLSQNWLDLTENFNWTGGTHTFSTTTIATSTITDLTVTGDTAGILKFGGTGADGALVTTATTTINLANANYVIKNYTSIDIELGEGLAFSNPATNGTIINLKSTGNCNIAGMIDASGMGAAGGAGGASNVGAGQGIQGTIGTTAIRIVDGSAHYGNKGGTTGSSVVGGAGGAIYTVTGLYSTTAPSIASKSIIIAPGSGGGGGQGARGDGGTADLEITDGATGGNGGGALIIECGGALTFSGVISVNGAAGSTSLSTTAGTQFAATGGGGGGGAAGMAIVLYDSLTANTGTITSAGGAGGGAGGATSSGGGGGGWSGAGGGGGGAIGGAGGAGSDGIGAERNALAGNAAGGISAGGGGAGGAWSNGVAKSSAAGGAGGATNSGVVVLNTEF